MTSPVVGAETSDNPMRIRGVGSLFEWLNGSGRFSGGSYGHNVERPFRKFFPANSFALRRDVTCNQTSQLLGAFRGEMCVIFKIGFLPLGSDNFPQYD
jgi:hypothetical protein